MWKTEISNRKFSFIIDSTGHMFLSHPQHKLFYN